MFFELTPTTGQPIYLQLMQQIRHAAHMIVMKMGDHQGIDLLDACVLGRRRDPHGIASAKAGISGIDQQGLPGRWHHQRRLPALGVNEVKV